MAIKRFRGNYSFLSNFYSCSVIYEWISYKNSEAAFQAGKTLLREEKLKFTIMDGTSAKRYGRRVNLRKDWEEVKINVMYEVVKAKFTQNADLRNKLIETEDEYLEEGNLHHDKFWGTFEGEGRNELGKILMRVRDEINRGEY